MAQNPLVGAEYEKYIGARQLPGQTQVEFYNKANNQAFANPQDLVNFVQPYTPDLRLNAGNIFSELARGYTPRDAALNQIKNDLNKFQEQTFSAEIANPKRAASSITDKVAAEQSNYDALTSEYNELRKRLTSLSAPNYQQQHNELRQQSGIPGIENDFAANQKTIRELPYVNRQNFGNAAVATEGQLSADTQQKGIPLEIQQANLLDRLKLAQSFVDNSLKFKELDQTAARQSLADALDVTMQTIGLSRQSMNDLLERQKYEEAQRQKAQQFAYENRIGKPFYEIGGTVYRTADGRPATSPQDYIQMGGAGDFRDVQTVDISQTFANQLAQAKFGLEKEQFGFEKDKFGRQFALENTKFDFDKYKFNQELGLKAAELELKAGEAARNVGGLNKDQVANLFKIRDDMRQDPAVKNFATVSDAFDRMQVGAKSNSAAGDMTMIFSYMKLLDPTSVVREGEYATAQNAAGIPDQIKNLYNKTLEGRRLNPKQITDFLNNGRGIYEQAERKHESSIDFYSQQMDALGIPTELGIQPSGSSFAEVNKNNSFTGPINPNNPAYKELKTKFPNASDAEIRAVFNQPTGTLSQKYESGGNPGAIGKDNTGGWSYGTYQLAHQNAQRFLDAFPMYGAMFRGLKLGTDAFNKMWKQVAAKDPQGFANAQHEFIARTHYEPQINKLKKLGFNVETYSSVLKDVIWSTAVQHGAATDVIASALKKVGKAASESQLIKAIYDERWSNGKRFASSTENVKKSVFNRFFGKGGELNTALQRLKDLIS